MPLKYFADYRVSPTGKWTNFYQSLSKISDKVMFPAGQEDGKVEVRFYCEDAFRATSDYVYKVITVGFHVISVLRSLFFLTVFMLPSR